MTPKEAEYWMQKTIELTWVHWRESRPNPCVGALAVKDGEILGFAHSQAKGGPHAEATLIQNLGTQCQGADLFVTLEPCSHIGKNPACAPLVATAGFKKVWIACTDPNPLVSGHGINILRKANIPVQVGICTEAALLTLSSFFTWIKQDRPEIWLKGAMTLEGVMASPTGPLPISDPLSKNEVFQLRSQVDAVLIGGETLRKDHPSLNIRSPDLNQSSQPIPIILSQKQILIQDCESLLKIHPEIWLLSPSSPETHPQIKWISTEVNESLNTQMQRLAKLGVHRILVECGPCLLSKWLKEGPWDVFFEVTQLCLKLQGIKTLVDPKLNMDLLEFKQVGTDLWKKFQNNIYIPT